MPDILHHAPSASINKKGRKNPVQRINFWKIGSNCFDRIVLIEVRVYALRLWDAIEVGTCS
jgi:hypothetical protein